MKTVKSVTKNAVQKEKLNFKEFLDKFIWLNHTNNEQVKCAFKNYRNPRVRLMTIFLSIQKMFTLCFIQIIQFKRETEPDAYLPRYREAYPELSDEDLIDTLGAECLYGSI